MAVALVAAIFSGRAHLAAATTSLRQLSADIVDIASIGRDKCLTPRPVHVSPVVAVIGRTRLAGHAPSTATHV